MENKGYIIDSFHNVFWNKLDKLWVNFGSSLFSLLLFLLLKWYLLLADVPLASMALISKEKGKTKNSLIPTQNLNSKTTIENSIGSVDIKILSYRPKNLNPVTKKRITTEPI